MFVEQLAGRVDEGRVTMPGGCVSKQPPLGAAMYLGHLGEGIKQSTDKVFAESLSVLKLDGF
jgi:hypothetical protein